MIRAAFRNIISKASMALYRVVPKRTTERLSTAHLVVRRDTSTPREARTKARTMRHMRVFKSF